MKMKYKAVMLFLTLLIFCVGSVCAAEPNNTTGDGGLNPVNPPIKNTTDIVKNTTNIVNVVNMVNYELEKRDIIINNQDLRIKALENSSAEKDIKINELNNTVNNQSIIINSLKDDNKVLTDSNKVLTDRVQALEYSKITQSNRIKSLEIDIKNLDESNKQLINSNKLLIDSNKVLNTTVNNQAVRINDLNTTVDNQAVRINDLNNKLELQLIEINKLQGDKDKLQADIKQLNIDIKQLNAEKDSIYEKLLNSPKKEELEQLKKDIQNKNKDIAHKDNLINELNTKIDNLNKEIKTLKTIYTVSKNDVYNSLKGLSSTNIQNIKCGKYTFKLEDYLKIPLIREGKKNVLKFKKDNGRLPKYVMIAGYKVPQKVYKKIYNL